jgi:soluble lytic murein transglycosylase-like protein
MTLGGLEVGGLVRRCLAHGGWLPPSYVVAHAAVESSFDPFAVGDDGRYGLMQVEPAACRQMGFPSGKPQFDALTSLKTGIAYIGWLHAFLLAHDVGVEGDYQPICEAYHQGPGAWLDGRRDPQYWADWQGEQRLWAVLDR